MSRALFPELPSSLVPSHFSPFLPYPVDCTGTGEVEPCTCFSQYSFKSFEFSSRLFSIFYFHLYIHSKSSLSSTTTLPTHTLACTETKGPLAHSTPQHYSGPSHFSLFLCFHFPQSFFPSEYITNHPFLYSQLFSLWLFDEHSCLSKALQSTAAPLITAPSPLPPP